jgi:predicted hydrocarbon binding protein
MLSFRQVRIYNQRTFHEEVYGVENVSNENLELPETISFTYNSFLNILKSLVNNFGSAGESIIFQMGREYGIEYCQKSLSTYSSDKNDLRDLFKHVIDAASKDGWANMELFEFNPQNGAIEVLLKHNVFQPACTRLHLPQCFFLRGYISGIIKELTNMDYVFFSSQCYAHGDENCSIKLVAQKN